MKGKTNEKNVSPVNNTDGDEKLQFANALGKFIALLVGIGAVLGTLWIIFK